MGQKDTSSDFSKWQLNINSGLGPIVLGDAVDRWVFSLGLYFNGDLESRLEEYFSDSKIKREKNPLLFGEYLEYRSSVHDLWIEVEGANRLISQISTAEYCFYHGTNLIGISAVAALELLNSKCRSDVDSLGIDLFFDEIGVIVRIGERGVVEWVTVEKINIE